MEDLTGRVTHFNAIDNAPEVWNQEDIQVNRCKCVPRFRICKVLNFAVYPHRQRWGLESIWLNNAKQNSSVTSLLFFPLSRWLHFSLTLDCNCPAAKRKNKPLISLRKRNANQTIEGIYIVLSNTSKGIPFLHQNVTNWKLIQLVRYNGKGF